MMANRMETTIVYWGYIGMMEKKMETTIVYWGYIGIMEKKMETILLCWEFRLLGSKLKQLRGTDCSEHSMIRYLEASSN